MSAKVDQIKLSRRQRVLQYLQGIGRPRSTDRIALDTAINKNTLRNDLNELRRNGQISAHTRGCKKK